MKLLFDANLSYRLVNDLAHLCTELQHVKLVGLGEASDQEIWNYAKANQFVIVTKDADFIEHSILHGHPPKVVWIRIGNCATNKIKDLLIRNHNACVAFTGNDDLSMLTLIG